MYRTLLPLAAVTVALAFGAPPARGGDIEVDGSFVSTVATGTAPLAVSSTTKVDNLDADLLDGLESSAFARALGNVVRVGKTGGDFGSIQSALDSITTASAANPFLVLVGPGVYDDGVSPSLVHVTVLASADGVGAGGVRNRSQRRPVAGPAHGPRDLFRRLQP